MIREFLPERFLESQQVRRFREQMGVLIGRARNRRARSSRLRLQVGAMREAMDAAVGHLRAGDWWFVHTVLRDRPEKTASWVGLHESILDGFDFPFLPDGSSTVNAVVDERIRLGRVEQVPMGGLSGAIIVLRGSETALVFDPDSSTVARWSRSGFSADYFALRDAFMQSVSSVDYQVLHPSMIAEPIVDAPRIKDLPRREHDESLLRVLSALSSHAAVGRLSARSDDWSSDLLLRGADLVPKGLASDPQALEWLRSFPLVASHGDLHGSNILSDGVRDVVIDFGSIAVRPAWFDASQLVALAASRDRESLPLLAPRLAEHLDRMTVQRRPRCWWDLVVHLLAAATPSRRQRKALLELGRMGESGR